MKKYDPKKCRYCGSTRTVSRRLHPTQWRQCNDCGRYYKPEDPSQPRRKVRILVVDIETLPGEKKFWRLGEEDWNFESITQMPIMLGWSAKWLFEPQVYSAVLTPAEAKRRDDCRIAQSVWKLFNEADIVIAHNGDNFDIPWLQTRWLLHDLGLPSPYLTVDTKKEAARRFYFPSNKMDAIAEYFGLSRKVKTDYELWLKCSSGDKAALDYMRAYNEQDVFTLEEIYMILRPWIKHPNVSLYMVTNKEQYACTHCGSANIKWFHGLHGPTHYTPARGYHVFQCQDCGAWGREFAAFKSTSGARTIN